MQLCRARLLVVLLAVFSVATRGATVYVDPSSTADGNCGSEETPCPSLHYAMNVVTSPGTTVLIKAGSIIKANTTAGNNNIWVSVRDVQFVSSDEKVKVIIDLEGASDMTVFVTSPVLAQEYSPVFKNLDFRNGGVGSRAIWVSVGGATISSCSFSHFEGVAVYYGGASGGDPTHYDLVLTAVQFENVQQPITMVLGSLSLQSMGITDCETGIAASGHGSRIQATQLTASRIVGTTFALDAQFNGSLAILQGSLFTECTGPVVSAVGGQVQLLINDATFTACSAPSSPLFYENALVRAEKTILWPWAVNGAAFRASGATSIGLFECTGSALVSNCDFNGAVAGHALSVIASEVITTSNNVFRDTLSVDAASAVNLGGQTLWISSSDGFRNNSWDGDDKGAINIQTGTTAQLTLSSFVGNRAQGPLLPSLGQVEGTLIMSAIDPRTLNDNSYPMFYCSQGNIIIPGEDESAYAAYIFCNQGCNFGPCRPTSPGTSPGMIAMIVLAAVGTAVLIGVVLMFARKVFVRRARRLQYTDLEGTDDGL